MGYSRLQAAAYEAEGRLIDNGRLQHASRLGRRYLSRTGISLDEVRAYLAAVQREPWFKAAFPQETRPITVESATGASSSNRYSRVIKSSVRDRERQAPAELVILHELAHMITKDTSDPGWRVTRKTNDRARDDMLSKGHSKVWRQHYMILVSKTFGPKWARRLRDEMDRQPGLCTCDGDHISPACREFGCCP